MTGKKHELKEQNIRKCVILKWRGTSRGENVSDMIGRQGRGGTGGEGQSGQIKYEKITSTGQSRESHW